MALQTTLDDLLAQRRQSGAIPTETANAYAQLLKGTGTPSTGGYTSQYKTLINSLMGQLGSYGNYESPYTEQLDKLVGQAGAFGSYNSPYAEQLQSLIDKAGSGQKYESPYAQELENLLAETKNTTFQYNAQEDPNYQALRKQYLLNAQRTTEDVLGQASAATGGRANSYAISAAGQAAGNLLSQFSENQMALYDAAYNRWSNEYAMKLARVEDLQGLDETAYNRHNDEYSKLLNQIGLLQAQEQTGYDRWGDQYAMLLDQIALLQSQDNTGYDRWGDKYAMLLEQLGAAQTEDATDYEKWLTAQQLAVAASSGGSGRSSSGSNSGSGSGSYSTKSSTVGTNLVERIESASAAGGLEEAKKVIDDAYNAGDIQSASDKGDFNTYATYLSSGIDTSGWREFARNTYNNLYRAKNNGATNGEVLYKLYQQLKAGNITSKEEQQIAVALGLRKA